MKSLFFEEEISYYNPNTLDKNCKSIILIEKPVFNGFSMIMSAQIELPITYCSDLVCNKTLKTRNLTPTHTNF